MRSSDQQVHIRELLVEIGRLILQLFWQIGSLILFYLIRFSIHCFRIVSARLFRKPRFDNPDDDQYPGVRFPNRPKLPHRYAAVAVEEPDEG